MTYTLRAFQQEAVDKFRDVKSILIGDDMGLGKTVEAIDLDWQRRVKAVPSFMKPYSVGEAKVRPTLVLTRMSVVSEWEAHYAWMRPEMRVVCLDPKDRPSFLKAIREKKADVYIMHWDALRLLMDRKNDPHQSMLKTPWFHIIGDEIHAIKNRKAKVTRALKALRTDFKTGLSGTPADNKPQDLWSILNWLYPNNWRSYWNFYKTYVEYEVHEEHGYHKITGVRNAEHLHKQMASFYIRRRKEDVLDDLPEKYYNTIWVDLAPAQRKAYDQMRKKQLAWVGEQEDKPVAAPVVVTQLLRLQQFAVASVDIVGPFKQRKRSKEYDPQAVAEYLQTHYGAEVWADQVDAFLKKSPELVEKLPRDRRYHKWFEVEVYKYILVDPSTKLDAAMEVIEDSNEPLVFFSQFKVLIDMFGERLKKAGISYGLLTGDTPQHERKKLIADFQAGKIKVFAGTIAAGGVGITLHRSSHVLFFDRAWSPSWNRQAEDRCHRMGQKNAVQVTDFMARNTIDLGRAQQIQLKWTWLQKLLGDKTLDYQKEMALGGYGADANLEGAVQMMLEKG